MKLFEYQAKHQLANYGIPIPQHMLVTSYEGARQAIDELAGNVTLRPQTATSHLPPVHLTPGQPISNIMENLFAHDMTIRSILVERTVSVATRIYVSLHADRRSGKLILTVRTNAANTFIEEQKLINPFIGLREYQARDLASSLDLQRIHWGPFTQILKALFRCYTENDAELITLNPLAITHTNQFIVIDARMHIDNAALQRQPDFFMLRSTEPLSDTDIRARQVNITYMRLNGMLSCIANGTGLGLATLDNIHRISNGAAAAGHLIDIGQVVHPEKIDMALKIALEEPQITVILVNLFATIIPGQAIAQGLIESYEGVPPNKPIVLRIDGLGSLEGQRIIEQAAIPNVYTEPDITAAIQHAITLTKG